MIETVAPGMGADVEGKMKHPVSTMLGPVGSRNTVGGLDWLTGALLEK